MPFSAPTEPTAAFLQGEIWLHRGQYQHARRCFEQALAEERLQGDAQRLLPVLINLGNACAVLGDHAAARAAYLELLEQQRLADHPDDRAIGDALANLGNLSRERGETSRAGAYYLEAADRLERGGDAYSLGILYSNIALLQQQTGAVAQAIETYQRAIELHKRCGHEAGLAATWGRLGRAFVAVAQDRSAETCFNYAYSHFNRLADADGQAEALRALAQIYAGRGDAERARACRQRVVETFRGYGIAVPEADARRLDDPDTRVRPA